MRFHIGISKTIFLDLIQKNGLECFAKPEQFKTVDEAVEAVKNDSREAYVIGDCDNQDDKGCCKGHG